MLDCLSSTCWLMRGMRKLSREKTAGWSPAVDKISHRATELGQTSFEAPRKSCSTYPACHGLGQPGGICLKEKSHSQKKSLKPMTPKSKASIMRCLDYRGRIDTNQIWVEMLIFWIFKKNTTNLICDDAWLRVVCRVSFKEHTSLHFNLVEMNAILKNWPCPLNWRFKSRVEESVHRRRTRGDIGCTVMREKEGQGDRLAHRRSSSAEETVSCFCMSRAPVRGLLGDRDFYCVSHQYRSHHLPPPPAPAQNRALEENTQSRPNLGMKGTITVKQWSGSDLRNVSIGRGGRRTDRRGQPNRTTCNHYKEIRRHSGLPGHNDTQHTAKINK